MLTKAEQYFLTVARLGSLTKAADALFIAQPSLTKYIKRLERELGGELFDRGKNPMELNDAGRIYFEYLKKCEIEENETRLKLNEAFNNERGRLRIGIPYYCGQCYLPEILNTFRKRYPYVQIELIEKSGFHLEKALENKEVDICILHTPVSNGNFDATVLADENIVLAAKKSDKKSEISLKSFSDYQFIMPHSDQKINIQVGKILSEANFTPQIYMVTKNVYNALSLCESGNFAYFMPEKGLDLLPERFHKNLSFHKIKEAKNLKWQLVSLKNKGAKLPPYAEFFIDLFKKQ